MHNIHTRKATADDTQEIFEWRNDPITRSMFFEQNEILWENHVNWFNSTLKNPERILIIGELSKEKIGVVRFDITKQEAYISININPSYRGKKLAPTLLLAAQKHLPQNIEILTAEIKNKNTASIKSFQKAGYTLRISKNENTIYEKKLDTIP